MTRLFPVLALLAFTGGCCVSFSTEVQNQAHKDLTVTVTDEDGRQEVVALPAGSTRVCGGIVYLGHVGWTVFDGKSQFVYPDVSAIGSLPDTFTTRSRFTRDFPCLRTTRHVSIGPDMMIYAGSVKDRGTQPPGFPIQSGASSANLNMTNPVLGGPKVGGPKVTSTFLEW